MSLIKEGLLKRFKNIEGKDEEQLKTIKEQGEKKLQILAENTNQVDDFKNICFRDKLNSEAKEAYDKIKEQSKKIDYTKLVCIGSGDHKYNLTIFLDLKTFAGSLYNGSLSLKAAKIKQRNMEDMITKLDYYSPKKEKYKTQRENILYNAREFYKGYRRKTEEEAVLDKYDKI